MITLEQAIELATKAHEDQWYNPYTVTSDRWDCHKRQTEFIDGNGNKVVWCNGDIFLVYSPYITHPLAVMEMMDTEEEKIVAVLHDVLKYNKQFRFPIGNKPYSLENSEIVRKIWAAIQVLTKEEHESYDEYIQYISLNKIAIKVKIADIVHNLSCSPSDHAKQKYLKAIPVLLKSL